MEPERESDGKQRGSAETPVSAMRPARSTSGRWPRSAATQRAVLDAAAALFVEKGYDNTSIDDIVKWSGISVGSIYHQFSGKADVFLALSTESLDRQIAVSRRETEKARAKGAGPTEAYLIGSEAFLMATWRNRQVSKVMIGDQGPPGYVLLRRETEMRIARGALALHLVGDPPTPDSPILAVTALMNAAAVQIVNVETAAKAKKVARYYIGLIRRLVDDEAS